MPKNNNPKYEAVLFDLDGTLLDTAPDLAAALNHVLQRENKATLPLADIRHVASDGALGLIKLGFNINAEHPEYLKLKEKILAYYQSNIDQHSCLFLGMEKILDYCEENFIPWGIVTNKPGYLTERLLKKLRLLDKAQCVVSGDTLKQRKPDPAPLLYAAKLLNRTPERCCYVGDAERDIVAAKAANMTAVGALYGYIPSDIDPFSWNADAYVKTPLELMSILKP